MFILSVTLSILKRSRQTWPMKTGFRSLTMDNRNSCRHAHDAVEECPCDRRGGVGVVEGDEMCVLREAVHHREDDGFARHLGQPFDEVHGDVGPHLGRHLEGLHGLCLVSVARCARPHPISHQGAVARNVELGAEAMEGFLNALMPR